MTDTFDLGRYKWREVTPEGGIALFSTHSNDGVLYEILDDKLDLIYPVTIDLLVADFNEFAR